MIRPKSASRSESKGQPAPQAEAAGDDADVLAGLVREIDRRHLVRWLRHFGGPRFTDVGGIHRPAGHRLAFEPDEFLTLGSDFRSLAEFYRLEKGTLTHLGRKMAREWKVSDEKLALPKCTS